MVLGSRIDLRLMGDLGNSLNPSTPPPTLHQSWLTLSTHNLPKSKIELTRSMPQFRQLPSSIYPFVRAPNFTEN